MDYSPIIIFSFASIDHSTKIVFPLPSSRLFHNVFLFPLPFAICHLPLKLIEVKANLQASDGNVWFEKNWFAIGFVNYNFDPV